jgi:Zn-dependent M16 (insulinase) family peptidase
VDTLRAFDESIAWAAAGNITAKDIEEAKLGLFQGVDAPVSPAGRGTREFMSGVTDEMQQQRRERLLDVTEHDVARVAEQYLVNAERQATAIIGPEGGAHNFAELEGWTVKSVDT